MATEPVKVLHIAAGNLYGGVEALLSTLASERDLFTRSRQAFALCFDGQLASELRDLGATPVLVGPVRVRQPWSVLRARARLSRILRDFDHVVCHSAWAHALFAPVVRRAGLRLTTFLHNETSGRHWLERWAARTPPDLVICNSRFTRQGAGLALPGAPSAVWYPAVAVEHPDPSDVSLRKDLDLPAEAVLIVQMGRFERLKGHERHLRALARLSEQPRWHCVQVGAPQSAAEQRYFDELLRLVKSLGIEQRVSFVGFRRDIGRILAEADIYCQPNLRPDSFGLSLAEALAAGVPVVTSAIGAAAEILGDSGVLVHDDAELVKALQGLIDNPGRRSDLAQSGRARWQALYDPRQQIPALDALLASAIEPSRGPVVC